MALAVAQLRGAGVAGEDIGVITPYSAQVARLRARPALEGVEVATVNAFQGREKEAILCSWVRANPLGELGFVSDRRRLTVALSRARRLLWQVGDSATLASSPDLAAVIEAVEAQGGYESAWAPPWCDALEA